MPFTSASCGRERTRRATVCGPDTDRAPHPDRRLCSDRGAACRPIGDGGHPRQLAQPARRHRHGDRGRPRRRPATRRHRSGDRPVLLRRRRAPRATLPGALRGWPRASRPHRSAGLRGASAGGRRLPRRARLRVMRLLSARVVLLPAAPPTNDRPAGAAQLSRAVLPAGARRSHPASRRLLSPLRVARPRGASGSPACPAARGRWRRLPPRPRPAR